ncbi:class I SAM-dependent methyltransferase [Dactylosporangium sp. CA-139066]|uniref:class I SAM-dependent methyltransferase n=1 Tax=Dactylosporangium sp. CA-139066 TaxID=3239930 RepID=UPI003D8FFB52
MDAEALRRQQREEWTLCAGGWRDYRANFAGPSAPITERMLQLLKLAEGEHVLDLACGNGNPTFAAAEAVGPAGRVLGVDLTKAMVDEGAAFAERHGIANVEFRVIPDETDLGVEPGTFDAATCRAGLQYIPDRVGAARAVFAALRPGGRFVAMTLGAPDLCMPFMLTNGIVARHVPLPKLGTDTPGPVGLSTVEQLEGVLRDAGFVDLESDRFIAPIFEAPDPAAAWRLFVDTAGPFMKLFASLSDEQRRAMDEDARRTFAEAFPEGPVRPTGEALVVCGVKPS